MKPFVLALSLIALGMLPLPALGQEETPKPATPDKIVLTNGDTLTGTIISAAKGVLFLTTGYSKKVSVEMNKIRSITTGQSLVLRLKDGAELKGKIISLKEGVLTIYPEAEGDSYTVKWDRLTFINPPARELAKYKGSIAFGGVLQDGNNDRQALSLSANAERRSEIDRLNFQFLWNYAEEDDVRTARDVYGAMKYDYFFSKKIYGYLATDLLSDEFKDLDLRVTAGFGGGWQAIEDEDRTLAFEAGLSYLSENFDVDEDDSRLTARLATNFSQTISKIVTLSDALLVYPGLESGSGVQVRNEAVLTTKLGEGWATKVTYIIDHDSKPSPGFEETDHTLLISIGYTFG